MVYQTHGHWPYYEFPALAPKRYKRSVVSGFVHRIYRACSDWKAFHESLEKAKKILNNNQYPSAFYEPIIHETLTKIVQKDIVTDDVDQSVISLCSDEMGNNVAQHNIADIDKFRFFLYNTVVKLLMNWLRNSTISMPRVVLL